MQKRGVLRKNFIEITIFVLFLIIILLAAVSYFTKVEGRVSKDNFRILIEKLQGLKEGGTTAPFVLYVEKGWIIKGFDAGSSPESCDGRSATCLCICKHGYFWQGDDCESSGFCKIVDRPVRLKEKEVLKQVELEFGFYDIFLAKDIKNILIGYEKFEEKFKNVEMISTEQQERSKEEILAVMNAAKEKSFVNRKCNCGDKCGEYAEHLVKYSKEYGLPDPLLALSLMMQESSCQNLPCNDAGYCGLMQISSSISGWQNPETNIKQGIRHLKEDKYDKFQNARERKVDIFTCKYDKERDGFIFEGCTRTVFYSDPWQLAFRGYNGCGCKTKYPAQDWFVEEIYERYGALKKLA